MDAFALLKLIWQKAFIQYAVASLSSIRLVAENLKACVDFATIGSDELDIDGEAGIMAHVQARSNMLLASLMGAVAFKKGLGSICSWRTRCPVCDLHGLANGVMLPFSMAFNEEGVPERFVAWNKPLASVKIIQSLDRAITCGDRYPC